ncbi:MAG: alpha-1,2-fucosyltransferase [Nitrospirae bacterium]|nr:alpha-1,2-fucosyltransferase [Nitrospirota bacterium]
MIVQMSWLGKDELHGFGNQFFAFFFLKFIESQIGCDIRYSTWLGNILFNLPECNPVLSYDESIDLEHTISREKGPEAEIKIIKSHLEKEAKVLELMGLFQYHTSAYIKHREMFFNIFNFSELIEQQINQSLVNLGLEDCPIICVHFRRGDYLKFANKHPLFWGGSFDAVINALSDLMLSSFKNSAIYLCSDDIEHCRREFELRNIPCITNASLFAVLDDSTRLISDFMMMAKSSALIIANSSLSFAAAMLNHKAKIFLRPCPQKDRFIPFDPWNSHVLLPKFPLHFP